MAFAPRRPRWRYDDLSDADIVWYFSAVVGKHSRWVQRAMEGRPGYERFRHIFGFSDKLLAELGHSLRPTGSAQFVPEVLGAAPSQVQSLAHLLLLVARTAPPPKPLHDEPQWPHFHVAAHDALLCEGVDRAVLALQRWWRRKLCLARCSDVPEIFYDVSDVSESSVVVDCLGVEEPEALPTMVAVPLAKSLSMPIEAPMPDEEEEFPLDNVREGCAVQNVAIRQQFHGVFQECVTLYGHRSILVPFRHGARCCIDQPYCRCDPPAPVCNGCGEAVYRLILRCDDSFICCRCGEHVDADSGWGRPRYDVNSKGQIGEEFYLEDCWVGFRCNTCNLTLCFDDDGCGGAFWE